MGFRVGGYAAIAFAGVAFRATRSKVPERVRVAAFADVDLVIDALRDAGAAGETQLALVAVSLEDDGADASPHGCRVDASASHAASPAVGAVVTSCSAIK
jgi:hypothetical protein